jgi:hypothetical protein
MISSTLAGRLGEVTTAPFSLVLARLASLMTAQCASPPAPESVPGPEAGWATLPRLLASSTGGLAMRERWAPKPHATNRSSVLGLSSGYNQMNWLEVLHTARPSDRPDIETLLYV